MPWRTAILRGTRILARCDEAGALVSDGGRVEIRYKPGDGKAYRAALANLQVDPAAPIHPDAYCGEGAPVEAKPIKAVGTSASKSSAKPAASHGATPTTHGAIFAYTDGACSGNPGPAGLGVVLVTPESRRELSEYLGIGTNN